MRQEGTNSDDLPKLPGSRACISCGEVTFRRSKDSLCPRCAFRTESLIERIEIDGLNRDLQLLTQFDAYYSQREARRNAPQPWSDLRANQLRNTG